MNEFKKLLEENKGLLDTMFGSSNSNRKSIFINITDTQYQVIIEEGQKRHNAKHSSFRDSGILMTDCNGKNTLPHEIGLLGEFAYHIHTGKKLDWNIYEVRDGGVDFEDGKVEIKTSTYSGNNVELKVKTDKFDKYHAKRYVLARIDIANPKCVELVGEISREDFELHKELKTYRGKGHENWVVGMEYLKTVKKI